MRSTRHILGNMIVRNIGILKIRLAPTRRRVIGRAEGKLGGRKWRYD